MNNEESGHSSTRIHASITHMHSPQSTQTSTNCQAHTFTLSHQTHTSTLSHRDPRSPTTVLSPAIRHNQNIGDSVLTKDPQSIRFVRQNPNSLRYHESCFEYQLCLEQMKSISADVIMLPETNRRTIKSMTGWERTNPDFVNESNFPRDHNIFR